MVNGAVLTSEKEAQRLAVNQRVVDGHASQGVAAQELVVTDGILNRSLSIGLSDPCRVGHHLVVGVKRTKVNTFVLLWQPQQGPSPLIFSIKQGFKQITHRVQSEVE